MALLAKCAQFFHHSPPLLITICIVCWIYQPTSNKVCPICCIYQTRIRRLKNNNNNTKTPTQSAALRDELSVGELRDAILEHGHQLMAQTHVEDLLPSGGGRGVSLGGGVKGGAQQPRKHASLHRLRRTQ